MRQQEEELATLGVRVAVVTFQIGPVVEAYVSDTNLTWPILVDEELKLYKSYGMERGRWWDLYGWQSIKIYMKLFAKGRMLKKPAGDTAQLGGDVLVSPTGEIRLHHIGNGPADRPAVEAILDIVRVESQKNG